jgi:hypothetical protein
MERDFYIQELETSGEKENSDEYLRGKLEEDSLKNNGHQLTLQKVRIYE